VGTVVVRDGRNVGLDLVAVDVSFEQVQDRRFRFDQRLQPAVAHEAAVVADELRLPDALGNPLMNQVSDALVGRLVPLQDGDLDVVEALADVVVAQLPFAFLHGVRIDRAADLQQRLLGKRFVFDRVTQVLHVTNRRTLDHLEDDDPTLRRPFVQRLHVDERTQIGEVADIALHNGFVERAAGACGNVRDDLRRTGRVVADDADFSD
jgi:hypothetical protein